MHHVQLGQREPKPLGVGFVSLHQHLTYVSELHQHYMPVRQCNIIPYLIKLNSYNMSLGGIRVLRALKSPLIKVTND